MTGDVYSVDDGGQTIWLSGSILTFLNKLLFPVLFVCMIAGVPLWVYMTTGHISIRSDFMFIVWFALIAMVPLGWFTVHLQMVGYRGSDLIVANYWRAAQIPFEQIEAVESVWWYKGRAVRVRFNRDTPFGTLVYYVPKWSMFNTMFSSPEQDLRDIVSARFEQRR